MMDAAAFLDLLDQANLNGDCPEPAPYSGRAMFGKQCVSISGDDASEWDIAVQVGWLARCYGHNMRDIPTPRVDSMGRGFVLYWPGFEWPEDRRDPSRYDDEEEEG